MLTEARIRIFPVTHLPHSSPGFAVFLPCTPRPPDTTPRKQTAGNKGAALLSRARCYFILCTADYKQYDPDASVIEQRYSINLTTPPISFRLTGGFLDYGTTGMLLWQRNVRSTGLQTIRRVPAIFFDFSLTSFFTRFFTYVILFQHNVVFPDHSC